MDSNLRRLISSATLTQPDLNTLTQSFPIPHARARPSTHAQRRVQHDFRKHRGTTDPAAVQQQLARARAELASLKRQVRARACHGIPAAPPPVGRSACMTIFPPATRLRPHLQPAVLITTDSSLPAPSSPPTYSQTTLDRMYNPNLARPSQPAAAAVL